MSEEKWKRLTREDIMKYEGRWDEYPLDYYPGYQGPDKPPRADVVRKIGYLEEYDKIWVKKWGSQGIGRLREVCMTRPNEDEVLPLFKKNPRFFMFYGALPDIEKWLEEWEAFAKIYKEEGVKIDYLEWPSPPIGAYGPMRWISFSLGALVVRGGAILPRYSNPFLRGRCPYFLKFLAEIGCPVLFMVNSGIWECAGSTFIIEDVLFTHASVASTMEGIQEAMPVLQRVGVKEIHIAHLPGPLETLEWPAGGTYHVDMLIGPVDTGVVVIYPPLCGYETIRWLRERGFKLIEIPADEQRDYLPSNCVILEPGKVIMAEGAKKTIKAVEKEGVEVIECPCREIVKAGGGFKCSSGYLMRDRGPSLDEIKR